VKVKKHMRRSLAAVCMVVFVLLLSIGNTASARTSVSTSSIHCGYDACTGSISVSSDGYWSAASTCSWIGLMTSNGNKSGSIKYKVTKNPTQSKRSGKIIVFDTNGPVGSVELTQDASPEPAVIFELDGTKTVEFGSYSNGKFTGTNAQIHLNTTSSWTASSDVSWIKVDKTSGYSGNQYISLSIDTNTDVRTRTGTITVKSGGQAKTCKLTQTGYKNSSTPSFSFLNQCGKN